MNLWVPTALQVLHNTIQVQVWCVSVPTTGTVCAGTGTGLDFLTMANPRCSVLLYLEQDTNSVCSTMRQFTINHARPARNQLLVDVLA